MEQPTILESGSTGRGVNSREDRHNVVRPGGCNTWLIEYTVAGAGRVNTASGPLIAKPGSFLMYAPFAPQDYGMDHEVGEWDHIWFCFTPRAHWHDWLHWPKIDENIHYLESPSRDSQGEILARMEKALQISSSMLMRRQDFIMTIIEEILLYCDIWNPIGHTAQLDERVRLALEYLCANLAEKIVLQDLARHVSLSPSRLSHLFREQVGQSPMQYLEERRLERARELLLMTRQPISQIAYDTGFSSPFYFSRFFKSRTGKSPSLVRASADTPSAHAISSFHETFQLQE